MRQQWAPYLMYLMETVWVYEWVYDIRHIIQYSDNRQPVCLGGRLYFRIPCILTVGSTYRCSAGVALTPLDTMQTGYTLTVTAPKRWTRTLQSVQRGQFKSMTKAIQKLEGKGVPRVYNMEEIRHPQPQCIPHLKSAYLNYHNHGTRKDSALYINCCLCVKSFTHLPQGTHDW